MSSLSRISAAAEMLARDLSRRRIALALVLALPAAFYGVSKWSDGGYNLTAGGIGVAWAVAGAGLFAALGARAVDERLALDGYRPAELFAGRFVLLLTLAVIVAGCFGGIMLAISDPPGHGDLMLAMALVALIAVPLGLAVGAVVPHELEGILVIVGIIGIQMSLPSKSAVVGALPLGGPQRLLDRAAYDEFTRGGSVLRSIGWAALLITIAVTAWRLRIRLRSRDVRAGHRSRAALVTATVAGAAIALIATAPAGATTSRGQKSGLVAYQTVLGDWKACLQVVGQRFDTANGIPAKRGKERGILITFPGGASFFVTGIGGNGLVRTMPDDDATRALIKRAQQKKPNCASQQHPAPK